MAKEIIVIFSNIGNFSKYQYMMLILSIAISYIIGSISPAMIISKMNGVDIKSEGSGNAGTTNVLRVIGAKAAVITLIFDILKGVIAVRIGLGMTDFNGASICAIFVVIGHIFPVFYKFKGGKGVATAFGAVLMINWPSAFAALILVILVVAISKKMSLGSIVGALSYPLLILYYFPRFLIFAIILASILFIKHSSNIKRLLNKEESEIAIPSNDKKKDAPLKTKDRRNISFIGMNKAMTALANIAAIKGHNVMMWSDDKDLVNNTRENDINEKAFPDFKLDSKIKYTHHIMTAANRRHIIVINGDLDTIKSQLQKISNKANKNTLIVNLILGEKGNEKEIKKDDVVKAMNGNPYAELLITSLPEDLIKDKGTILYVKSDDEENIDEIKQVFGSDKIDVEVKK